MILVAGPFAGPPCPCSTVQRIRLTEQKRSFGAGNGHWSRGQGSSLRAVASRKSEFAESGNSDNSKGSTSNSNSNGNGHGHGKRKDNGKGGGVTRRAVMGLLALASPALMSCDAKAVVDVPEPLNDSQRMRLEMLQSIQDRMRSKAIAAEVPVVNDVAPDLKEEAMEVQAAPEVEAATTTTEAAPTTSVSETSPTTTPAAAPPTVSQSGADEDLRSILSPALTPAFTQPVTDSAMNSEVQVKAPPQKGGSFGFLSSLGVLGSGVLGALYWLEGRAKTSSKAALDEANSRLKKTQAALETLKETMDKTLTDQQAESSSRLIESEKGRVAVANELTSLKLETTELQLQLESQRNVNQNLEKKVKINQTSMKEAEEKVRNLEDRLVKEEQKRQVLENDVKCGEVLVKEREEKLAIVEAELREQEGFGAELRSQLCSTKTALVEAEDKVAELGRELIVARSCLDEREDAMEELKQKLAAAVARAEGAEVELAGVRKEVAELEESSSRNLAAANLAVSAKEDEVADLRSKLTAASAESQRVASDAERLQLQIQKLEENLVQEQAAVKQLSDDLRAAVENIELKTDETTALSEQLKFSREENELLLKQKRDLEDASKAEVTFLTETLHAEQAVTSRVRDELEEARSAFQASSSEVKSLSDRLVEVLNSNKRMQGELVEVRQTADATMVTLNDEKKKVVAAEKQFIETQKALAREEMLVESLRSEFSKAMDALNDLRKHLGSLSKDLQEANVKIAALENEKGSLLESLAREKTSAKALKDKASSAESELTRMVREKDGSFTKASKLEDELNVAEAEMLKLKEQMLLMGNVIDSAETRMGSIAQVNVEVTSLLRKFERITPKGEKKHTFKTQIDRLKEQSKAASEISKELRNMKQLLSHFQQNLNEAEIDRVEAEAALQAVVQRNTPEEEDRRLITVSENRS